MTMRSYRRLCSGLLAVVVLHGHGADAQDAVCATNLGDVRVRGNLNVTSRCQLTETEVEAT